MRRLVDAPRRRSILWSLVVAGLVLHARGAAGQSAVAPPAVALSAEERMRLALGARDPRLEPWQQDFMRRVARGGPDAATIVPAPEPPRSTAGSPSVDGDWTLFDPPSGSFSGTAIYDPVRERMVVFGGRLTSSLTNGLCALSLGVSPSWSGLAASGTAPPGRTAHAAIYDPVRDRMLVFGGLAGSTRQNDVWALSLGSSPAWSELAPVGTPPSGRLYATAIYDPVRDRMLVFAGEDDQGFRNDVWELPLNATLAWSQLSPSGTPPLARAYTSAIYDPVRDRMVVFGGYDGSIDNDAWALSLAPGPAWSELSPAGVAPPARVAHSAIYDPVNDRMVVFGGFDGANDLGDVWGLALAGNGAWSELSPSGTAPAARADHEAIYDPLQHRMLVFAGQDATESNRNDVWALGLVGDPSWSEVLPNGPPPGGLDGPSAIYDPLRHRLVVFGGFADQIGYQSKVWALTLGVNPTWSRLLPAGTAPDARNRHSAIYDPVRDRMLVFGGTEGFSLNDVWALSLGPSPVWSQLFPSGPPSPRFGHTAVYDPVRDRMIVFGGYSQTGGYSNEVLILSLSGAPYWAVMLPTGTPPAARYFHSTIYDPVRDRIVVYGGAGSAGGALGDVWALTLAGSPAWSPLAPAGAPPTARYWHGAIYDPVRDRMVVFGGYAGISSRNDSWALSLADTPAWSPLDPGGTIPSARSLFGATYDPERDRMVVFGGVGGLSFFGDVAFLAWAPQLSVPGGDGPPRLVFASPRPNPSREETTLEFALEAAAHVTLDVFDTQGRCVKRITDGWFTAGPHAATWRGDGQDGHPLGAGLYFVRIQAVGVHATRRLLRLP
jgi:hypothetical protein